MRRIMVFVPVLLIVVLVILSVTILFNVLCVRQVDLDFAEKVILNYEYNSSVNLEIIDSGDISRLKTLCRGTAVNDFSVPSCGFGTAELIFEGNGKRVSIYPACDSCSTMRLEAGNKFFYNIPGKDREELITILEKYGAIFPCV